MTALAPEAALTAAKDGAAEYCFHCGLGLQKSAQFCADIDGQSQQFCCPACALVAQFICDSGYGDYYRYAIPAESAAQKVGDFSYVDSAAYLQQFSIPLSPTADTNSDLRSIQLLVTGMHCAACVWLLDNFLQAIPGVKHVQTNLAEQRLSLSWDNSQCPLSQLFVAIARLGYQPDIFEVSKLFALQREENRQALRRLGVAGIAMMQVGMYAIAMYLGVGEKMAQEHRDFIRLLSLLITLPVVFYSAAPFFQGALRGLRQRSLGIDLPVAVAIGLAFSASCWSTFSGGKDVYFDSVSMFTFLLLAGRYLQMRARHHLGEYRDDLLALLPNTVERQQSQTQALWETVPLAAVAINDVLRIKPGCVVPADGLVTAGESKVNEAQLSGEFWPVKKAPGDTLVAGSANISQTMLMQVEQLGAGLYLQQLNEMADSGRRQKPGIELLADRLAKIFVAVVLACAFASYALWLWLDAGQAFWVMLSVLVVSCPCALALATPMVLTSATQALRRRGVLVRSAEVWDKLESISDVVFDKTGTLTTGELSLSGVHCLADWQQSDCLEIIAALEQESNHPIARAFRAYVRAYDSASRVDDLQQWVGQGISGEIDGQHYRLGSASFIAALSPDHAASVAECATTAPFDQASGDQQSLQANSHRIYLANKQQLLCEVYLVDQLRADVEPLLASLKRRGIGLHILSGDSSGSAEQLASKLAIDHCQAAASPQQKQDYVRGLQQRGARVLMLGDGINDLPVMAVADISVAVANANSVAKLQADVMLMTPAIVRLDELWRVAARTRRLVRQNIAWALLYNLSAIPLAMCAMVPPYFAALGMSASSLLVVVNAQRILRPTSNKVAGSGSDMDSDMDPDIDLGINAENNASTLDARQWQRGAL